ncbi:MAG: NAD(P)H-dependent glycerol-3-phosphate dehydrogenase [Candidatus Saelkia tenebricola]|nr:NAD(P)H-dependent glycerol-3-phosphate dehydrogenase [Candidatus Saelkia tenebricola]
MQKVCILGDGSWGTTLAMLLFAKGCNVTLWSYDSEYAVLLDNKRENIKFLPGITIPEGIEITSCIDVALKDKDFIVIAVPSVYFRGVVKKIKGMPQEAIFISVTKGIEIDKFKRASEVIVEELGKVRFGVLSGPTIANEVVSEKPSSVVSASSNEDIAKKIQNLFLSPSFRIYTSCDVIGVELGGAIKNIIAIAAGICDGLELGNNAKAALLSRGLAEMVKFGKVNGARSETFFGLSGLGDMITTCFSPQSRNRSIGEKVGRGMKLKEILKEMDMIAEGIYTVKAVYEFSKIQKIDMPITEKVYQVLYDSKNPRNAVNELMQREPKSESVAGE